MLGFMLAVMLVSGGPETPADDQTRAEALQAAREQKALNLHAPSRTFLENALYQFKERRVMERIQEGVHGFRPLLGGMATGSGFAAGASFSKGGFETSAQVSISGYQKYESRFSIPRIAGDRFFADAGVTYRNFTREDFFGNGSDTRSVDRTSYRREDVTYGGRFGVRLKNHLKAGAHLNLIETNIGTGTDPRFPSTEQVFAADDVPALANQPSYVQTGAFLEYDSRDIPGNPRSGGKYTSSWSQFHDRKLGQYGFTQFDAEAQQYFPFFHQRRVVVLRAKTTLTQAADGNDVPFFMQPTLGGSEDLRGYTESRFRDRNLIVFNGEYRWEAFSGLDLALFADAGKVGPKAGDLSFSGMKTAAGIGFRFNTEKSVFLRVDVGASQEGPRVFVKFGHVF
jgi:outer membrane protein assembly factor BamA